MYGLVFATEFRLKKHKEIRSISEPRYSKTTVAVLAFISVGALLSTIWFNRQDFGTCISGSNRQMEAFKYLLSYLPARIRMPVQILA